MKNIFAFLLLCFACCQNKQKEIPNFEVSNTNAALIKTDENWFYEGNLFSGYMVEKESDGQLVYKLPILEGKQQGIAIGWYNSGEKLLERIYINGKCEGIFKQWWPNGQLRYLFNYENDVFQGKQIVYFPNGNTREESNYQSGEKEGIQRVWNGKGLLISNYTLKNKKLYGVITVKSCIPTGH